MQHICKQAFEHCATSRLFGASLTMTNNMDIEANKASQSECGMCISGPRTCCPLTEHLMPLQCPMHKPQTMLEKKIFQNNSPVHIDDRSKSYQTRDRVSHRIQMCALARALENSGMHRCGAPWQRWVCYSLFSHRNMLRAEGALQYLHLRGLMDFTIDVFWAICVLPSNHRKHSTRRAQICWSH